jgi:transposase
MLLKTILNRIERYKSFVYGKVRMLEENGELAIEIEVEARANGRPICSGCGRPAAGYDRLPKRRFEYVPIWGIAVFLVYAMRRVNCPRCKVKVGNR